MNSGSQDLQQVLQAAAKNLNFERRDSTDDEDDDDDYDSVDGDDPFAPVGERVRTFDYANIQSATVPAVRNEAGGSRRGKGSAMSGVGRQLRQFLHEGRGRDSLDELGNVELPMDPYEQSSEDHDSGFVSTNRLFRMASLEQSQLDQRNRERLLQGLRSKKSTRTTTTKLSGDSDYEFLWYIKSAVGRRGVRDSVVDNDDDDDDGKSRAWQRRSRAQDLPDGVSNVDDEAAVSTTLATTVSRVGSTEFEFQRRTMNQADANRNASASCDAIVDPESLRAAAEAERQRKILNLFGLSDAPTADAVTGEEMDQARSFQQLKDTLDGYEPPQFPCDCCDKRDIGNKPGSIAYYDILFSNRKNESFSVRFDMIHCLPRFVIHYKFYKQLPDCLTRQERLDLVRAASDICVGYNVPNCTLQVPFGRYRTNAYPAFFAYLLVPDHEKYLEIFDVANPAPSPNAATKGKKSKCLVPNWPDKSFVTRYWAFSHRQGALPSDRDPTLNPYLYHLNLNYKLNAYELPEILVTRQDKPKRLKRRQKNDLGFFNDFALVLHSSRPMLGFATIRHPQRQPDINFIAELFNAMLNYVRQYVNTRQRKFAGKDDLACCINVSLQHSYTFKANQGVYGFITFPATSTYWKMLDAERKRNDAIAECEVTHRDIRASVASESTVAENKVGRERSERVEKSLREETKKEEEEKEEEEETKKFCRFM